jgi:hypothetical protein
MKKFWIGFLICLALFVAFVWTQGRSQDSKSSYGLTPVKGSFKETLLTADFVVNDGVSPLGPEIFSDLIYAFLYTVDSVRSPGPKNFKHTSELSVILADALKESSSLQTPVTVVQADKPGGESSFSGKLITARFFVRDADAQDAKKTERMVQDFFSVLENKRNDRLYLQRFNARLFAFSLRVYVELKNNQPKGLPVEQQ